MTNANDFFGSSMGTEKYYQSSLGFFVYTDGVKKMADDCGAHWLIDLVASHQVNRSVRLIRFQTWLLTRVEGEKFQIIATDGNDKHITSQDVPYSDFRYDVATLWLVNGCLMLPKEY